MPIDYFENYELQPKNLLAISDKWNEKNEADGLDYNDLKDFLEEVNDIGYTFEYGLCGTPFNLFQIEKWRMKLEHFTEKYFENICAPHWMKISANGKDIEMEEIEKRGEEVRVFQIELHTGGNEGIKAYLKVTTDETDEFIIVFKLWTLEEGIDLIKHLKDNCNTL